jgi:predicted enzyme related to lactoylglutathione lyase
MPKRDSYKQGTPCWTDLQTTDVDGAKAFYGALFGWTFDDMPTPTGAAYSLALVGPETVAAIAPQPPMLAEGNVPAMWNTYIAVDDADKAVAAAHANGGTVLMAADDIPGSGRMAFVADPSGAAVGLWQAGARIGATLVNEPNTLTWNELITADTAAALPFYKAVANIDAVPTQMGGIDYTMLQVDGSDVGGSLAPQMANVPNHWHTWFAVTDANAVAAAARGAGGTLLVDPMAMPIGTMATIRDPQGAVFSILQPAN